MIDRSISNIVKKMIANGIVVADDLRLNYAPNAQLVGYDPTTTNSTENSNSPSNNSPSNNITDSSNDDHNAAYLVESPGDEARGEPEKTGRDARAAREDESPDDTIRIHFQSTPAADNDRNDVLGHNMANTAMKPKISNNDHLDMSQITKRNFREEGGATAHQRQGTKMEKRVDSLNPTHKVQKWADNQAATATYSRGEPQIGDNTRGQPSRRFNQGQETGPM